MVDMEQQRARMVALQLKGRGIADAHVLAAFGSVPREQFVPEELAEFAYEDAPLPLSEGQTISQPYIVAMTVEALGLRGGERVLEIGTGSGYAAAILSRIAKRGVHDRAHRVAGRVGARAPAAPRLSRTCTCVRGDGTLGWPEHAPYDAIAVAAGGPKAPPALLSQLAIGGRLVMPIGPDETSQTARAHHPRERNELSRGEPGRGALRAADRRARVRRRTGRASCERRRGARAASAASPSSCARPRSRSRRSKMPTSDALIERIGDARLVLLGEATHGTSEFYRMRARITQQLIARCGFRVRRGRGRLAGCGAHRRLRARRARGARASSSRRSRASRPGCGATRRCTSSSTGCAPTTPTTPSSKAGFHGLDLYSLFTSIAAVVAYLDRVDPEAAAVARARYGTLTRWQRDPAAYGRAVLTGRYQSSEHAVVTMLRDMLERRFEYARRDGERFFDAAQNARLVANAERYYRAMYYSVGELVEPARRAHVRHAASRCSRSTARTPRASSGSTTRTSATPARPT